MSTTTAPWNILNVRILHGDGTGRVDEVADIDAASTAEALAYFMRTRHLDDDATEAKILGSVAPDMMLDAGWRTSRQAAVFTDPMTGGLVDEYVAEVH